MKKIFFTYLGIFLSLTNFLAAQIPTIEIERSGDDVILHYSSDSEHYYILKYSEVSVDSEEPIGMALGDGLAQALVDEGILGSSPSGFYRLEAIPKEDPKDTDDDGIHDVTELDYQFLDPLNPDDAGLDFDDDGFLNNEEINSFSTDPSQANASVLPPRILGLSFAAAKEALELAGFQVGRVSIVPTVHNPGAAVISPDLSPYIGIPSNALIDVTVSLPLDPNLFIDQTNLTPFDGNETNSLSYYAAVDPLNERTNLADWIAANRFGDSGGEEASAYYFNDADLGFGRRMTMRKDSGGIAYYTINYLDLTSDEAAANDAAVGDPIDIATVCMEFSPHPVQGGDPYVKFFTFNGRNTDPSKRANPAKGPGERLNAIDLDFRGAKFQPGMCMTCHGGLPRELDNGVYPNLGRAGARFIPFDVDSFTYPTLPGFSRAEQEDQFKELNRAILDSIPEAIKYSFVGKIDIPDADFAGVDIPLTVSGFSGAIADLNFSFDGIGPCSNAIGDLNNGLTHTWVRDLVVTLISPQGTSVTLLSRQFPSDGNNFCRTELDDEATRVPSLALLTEAPFSGLWQPFSALSAFDGENPNGTWVLNVSDQAGADTGSVNQFSLHITPSQRTGAVSELIEGWYGGPTLPNDFNEDFIPSGWQTPESFAEGGDHVYHEVVAKTCRACHVMLTDRRPDLDFNSYDEFAVRRGLLKDYVFDRGLMPMAKRTFDKFWKSTNPSQPEVLAAWLDAPNRYQYSGPPVNIPDAGSGGPATLQLNVSGFTGTIEDLDFSFDGIGPCSATEGDLNNGLTHSFVGDLRGTLTSPAGTSVRILDQSGQGGNNLCETRFDDNVQTSLFGVTASQAPYMGSWRPFAPLSAFNGEDPNGTWTLEVEDLAAADTGSVQQWSLHFNSLGKVKGPGAPIARINAPMSVTGTSAVNLDASGSLFADSFDWTLISPSGSITDSSSINATLEFVDTGIYTIALTVRNAFGKDVATKDIELVNEAPEITSLLATSPIIFPTATTLSTTVIDDGFPLIPGTLSFLWEKASGPGNVYFESPSQQSTTATFSQPGTYVLCLTATDGGGLMDVDQVSVTIDGDMVLIDEVGNPANPTTNEGAVGYEFQIGKNEVTNAQYAAFLNAVAGSSDPYGLWNQNMSLDSAGGIDRIGLSGDFTYILSPGMESHPVNYVQFFDAVRYVNWLHNGAAPGGSTEDGAYSLLGGTAIPSNGETVTRNQGALWHIPNRDEWYKAAYYEPFSGGGDTDNYWAYATQSNTATATAPPGTPPAANFGFLDIGLTAVGAYTGSHSYFETNDQSGNVWEFSDTIMEEIGSPGTNGRLMQGGGAFNSDVASDYIFGIGLNWDSSHYGFRVAAPIAGTGGNLAPLVNAGSNIDHNPPSGFPTSVSLNGSINDDGLPAPPFLTSSWSQISGPAGVTATFTNASSPATAVSFPQHGDYTLRLTANDGELSSFDDILVRVLVSFENDIVPLLTVPASTCLGCHNDGFAAGGLSLGTNSSTPKSCADIYAALAPGSGSIRVNTSNPSSSRLLVYPAQGSGGSMPAISRYEMGSSNYNKILLWIEQGAENDCTP